MPFHLGGLNIHELVLQGESDDAWEGKVHERTKYRYAAVHLSAVCVHDFLVVTK